MTQDSDHTISQIIASHSIGSTVQDVLDSIFSRVKSGTYPLNTRLPSERSLATELGVARNTVREALDVLEKQKVIDRRPGSGSFVVYNQSESDPNSNNQLALETSPLNLLALRGILEPEIVRLAVINMVPREIGELEKLVSKIESTRTDVTEFVTYEEELYRKIASGTHNPLLASCYDLVIEAGHSTFRSASLRRYLTPNRIFEYQKRYNALFNAISTRDVEAAVELIKLHLIEHQRYILQEDQI